MKRLVSLVFVVLVALTTRPVRAADNVLERLATCQDSWMDWKDDAAKVKTFRDTIDAGFTRNPQGAAWSPKAKTTILGLAVTEIYPQTVGMGVGFSATVAAPFDAVRAQLEKTTGKTLKKCEAGDGMKSCELELAPKRTLMLMSEDNAKSKSTLVGCYYLYEK